MASENVKRISSRALKEQQMNKIKGALSAPKSTTSANVDVQVQLVHNVEIHYKECAIQSINP